MVKAPLKFPQLAALIEAGRKARNLTQAELASELGFKQQAVSRWEAGTHRPTVSQVDALASLIGCDASEIMTLAGYAPPIAATFTTLFPVDALEPATFEYFVRDVVQELNPEATVRVQGSSGHNQAGTDVLAKFPDGKLWSFQCKRVERFGKSEIEKAVNHHSIDAARKFIVLSRIASPGAADAVEAHSDWTLWDKQDLTHLIRRLPNDVQDRLVDIYFRGQRMALLGRNEPGPWVSADRYFAPFVGRAQVFSHDWALVGRDTEIDALLSALGSEDERVTLLIGPGGIGKTRILKEALQRFAADNPATKISFLSTSGEPTAASLEGLGTKSKLIVVDDAHDRESLGLIISYAADPRNNARLLIATRPYAEQRIRNDLALVSIVDMPTVRLDRLDTAALTALVVEVLKEFGADPQWADSVVGVAGDSPLVAAMAARVLAQEGLVSELAKGESGLRQIILARFTKVITGNLGAAADAPLLRAVLEVLAIIQPFHVDDTRLGELVASTRPGIDPADVSRALKLLIDGGVIFKRGSLYRLMPDLLGDFLIEQCCIGTDGQLTAFPLTVANAVDAARLTQVLVNLGRMDWRLAGGDPSGSRRLQPLWSQLNAIDEKYDPRIAAVEAVAYYQPKQAMDFVQAQIDAGRTLHEFGTILRRVALSPEHRLDALRLLWDLGRTDSRQLNAHPGHPIRVLAELVGFEQKKPLAFSEEIAEFAFGLVEEDGAWSGGYTPFDVLQPLLSGEGVTTKSTARGITMSPFFIAYHVVAHLRARLIKRTLEMLEHQDLRMAHRAAGFLQHALRSPHGMLNSSPDEELRELYDTEFEGTIGKIGELICSNRMAPTTVIGLIHSVEWFAQYGDGALRDMVQAIFRELPTDLEFRLYAALSDAAHWQFVGQVPYESWQEDHDEWMEGFAAELVAQYDAATLANVLIEHLDTLEAAGEPINNTGPLIDRIVAISADFVNEIIRRSIEEPDGRLCNYLGYAVGNLLDQQPDRGRTLIRDFLRSPSPRLRSGAGRGLISLRRPHGADDVALLATIIGTPDLNLSSIGLLALRTWRDLPDRQVIELALGAPFEEVPELFEQFCMLACSRHTGIIGRLSVADVQALLQRMKALPRLEGHWSGEILQRLAKEYPMQVAAYLFARADHELENDTQADFGIMSYRHRRGDLGFHESAAAGEVLPVAWAWLRKHDHSPGWMKYEAAEVFNAMFKVNSDVVVEFLERLLDQATASDLLWMGGILRHSHHSFALNQRRFVQRLLERCKEVDRELVAEITDEIWAAASSGSWSGTMGEPMPRDIKARDGAKEVLATLSRLSPAYSLYQRILEGAERNIARKVSEVAALDDEE